MNVGGSSVVGYTALGRSFMRQRLRENPWPIRGDGWLKALFPAPTGGRPLEVLEGLWYDNSELTGGEWGFGINTTPQLLNSPTNPVAAGSYIRIRLASTGGTPGSSLTCYAGKRPDQNPVATPPCSVSGNDILVDFSPNNLLALVSVFDYGRMYCEVWDAAYPDPVSVFEFYVGPSMLG